MEQHKRPANSRNYFGKQNMQNWDPHTPAAVEFVVPVLAEASAVEAPAVEEELLALAAQAAQVAQPFVEVGVTLV